MRDKILILGLSAALLMSLFCYVQEIAAGYDGLSERIPVVGDDVAGSLSNVPPVVEVVPDVSSGKAPLRVQFEGDVYDEDGEITSLEWDFEGDGAFEVTSDLKSIERPQKLQAAREGLQKEHVYDNPGIYHAVVRVTDDKEESTTASVTIQVYSDRPWLDITPSNKDGFLYQAQAGYEAFFGENVGKEIKFELNNAYITYRMVNQSFGAVNTAKGEPEGNRIWYRNVFPGVDIRYTVHEDLLLEEFVVYQPVGITVIEQEFVTHGVDYKMEEDGSIGFYNGEDLVFSIPKPVMYEFNNPERKCYGLHYEVVEKGNLYILRKVIDNLEWLKSAKYPVVIDSSTQGEIADPWEQQGLTPYGQYFQNMNEYVDPLTGHLNIRQTDYSLSGRGLDLSISRVYSTVVAYKEDEEESGSGEYVPIATYKEAPTDLGYGWSLDFPWLEFNEDDQEPGHYLHLPKGVQIKTNFVDGVWIDETHHFVMYINGDYSYTKYRDDGVREDYDSQGRLTSITDLNGNVITFSYGQYGISQIADTVGRTVTFNYSSDTLMSITDGVRTISYSYSGGKLTAVTDPIGRVTTYEYMSENSFLITGVHYPSGGFSSYEYGTVIPEAGKIAPYKSSETEDGETQYYFYKVDSPDTVTWTSPKDLAGVTGAAGRPYVVQRDDGSFVMYFKEKYVWTETVWKCGGGDCWEEIITHTEYWIKRSTSTDQQHWSTPQNVLQVKSTTGNPIVIEKQDGTLIMYYMDHYQWTEENCYWDNRLHEWVCETITHNEFYIYRRSSSDGITWGSPVKVQQTTVGVRNIAAIQKQDGTFLLVYMDKVGSAYYMRQKTSADGLSWGTASNVVQVDSGTGGPALLQADSGTVYLAYRKGNSSLYVTSNSGSEWSTPVQTTGVASGDPAFLQTETEIVLIYKGTDNYCYRISSSDGANWSSPSQIAPNKIVSDPASVQRTDRSYRVTAQYISASALDLVKITEFSYTGSGYLSESTDVLIRDSQTLKSSMHFEYDSKGRTTERISKDENGTQTEKTVFTYNNGDKVIRQDVYAGTSTGISYSVLIGYDNGGNVVYTRNPEGAEHFYSYANTNSQNQFIDSKGNPVQLFSNQFYTNSVPSHCHTLLAGEAFINNGKVTECYYKYDNNGNMIETKTLYPTRDYEVFSGTFDENGQTTFDIDLTGLTITDAVLVISSIAVPTQETLYETHSEVGKGWLDTGTWSGKYFMADYFRCYSTSPPDCFDGSTKIGPFEHYPGTPNYTGYTTWVEENTQYVKTSYTAIVNEYPEMVEYSLNDSSWNEITDNLGSGTTSTLIPESSFVQGANTLQLRESNAFSTRFDWVLYIDQGATPQEYMTSLAYDSNGNVISATDAKGNTTLFSYDSHYMYLTSLTDTLSRTISAAYNFTTGWMISVTDAQGNVTSYEYDELGRVTKKILPDLAELEVSYDDQNSTVTIYDELDHFQTKYYDGLGRLIRDERYLSPSSALTEIYTYNYMGKMESRTDSGGQTYSYQYDSLGRPTRITNPDSSFVHFDYNYTTNTVNSYDENQHRKQYHYDWTGLLLWVKEYTGPESYYFTEYKYDSLGHLTSLTDARGNTTSYEYGSLFGATQVTYPDSTNETYLYDAVGNVVQKTDANGTTGFVYDNGYQLSSVTYTDGSVVTFEYDVNGSRTLLTDSEGSTWYTYDNRNRLLSETRSIDGQEYTVSYSYDLASRLVSTTYPDQTVITYEYDAANRLVTIPGYAHYTYNADSLVESVGYANDVIASFQYDSRNRPISIQAQSAGSDVLSMSYQYDPVGNITEMDYGRRLPDQQWNESQETFEYDWLDRVVSAQGDYGLLSYSYDPVGNRVSQNGVAYTYNEMNELISTSDGILFTYDGNGNTLSKADRTNTWIYSYDSRNQLKEVQKDQHMTAQYWYDGDNRRVKKTEWKDDLQEYQTTIYIYSGTNVIYEKNVTTDGEADYICSSKGLIAKKVGDYVDYYHTDHVGSTRLVTNEEGQPVAESEYDPFGATDTEEGYLFNGKEKDSTGLYYYGARYYSPETGRFITRDPLPGKIESPQTSNQYVYCLNNPLKYVDPRGMDCEYVILPDGTISYDLAELYNKMQKALETMSEEDWAQLDEYLAPGTDAATKMEAVKVILEKAGINFKDETTSLEVEVGTVNFTIEFSDLPFPEWGETRRKKGFSTGEILLSNHIHSGGDLFLVLGHEMTHAYMLSYHENSINSVQCQFGDEGRKAYMELISYQWEVGILNQVPHVSLMQRETILEQFDRYKLLWPLIQTYGAS
ncbi:MAG: exo-alpha-sialidase [Theionarchaea archaeon]|nr:exo-alpha-sialidase [Theionarchaea archaeon]